MEEKSINVYLETLGAEFERVGNAEIALGQQAYMRDLFEFHGIKAPLRREIQRPFLVKAYLPDKSELEELVLALWNKPQREYQHFGMDLAFQYRRQFVAEDIDLLEYMVVHKSWWDTVDFIATTLMGTYFNKYPGAIAGCVDRWLDSGNIWLQRCCLLFQMKYKKQLDTALLSSVIHALLGSREFFINKAIGWALRDYSKVNPAWVKAFVAETDLAPLSRREAIRLMDR